MLEWNIIGFSLIAFFVIFSNEKIDHGRKVGRTDQDFYYNRLMIKIIRSSYHISSFALQVLMSIGKWQTLGFIGSMILLK